MRKLADKSESRGNVLDGVAEKGEVVRVSEGADPRHPRDTVQERVVRDNEKERGEGATLLHAS